MAEAEVKGNDLNFDNLVDIFSYIPPRDLVNASQVCRLWCEAADTSSLWKRHCFERWSFCNLNVSPGTKTWKKYFVARYRVDTGAATGRPGLDYVCKSLRGHKGLVTDVIFITNNDIYDEGIIEKSAHPIVASCGQDKTVGIWNAKEGKSLWRKADGHDSSVSCLALIKPNTLFVSGDEVGVANFWDVTTGQHTKLQEEHGSIAEIVSASNVNESNDIYIASRSGEVKLWDVRDTTQSQMTIQTPLLGLKFMKVKQNQTLVLSGTDSMLNSSGIKVYDIRNLIPEGFRARQQQFQPPNSSLNHPSNSMTSCMSWIPNRPNQLAAGYNNGSVIIWDISNQQVVYSFRPHVGSVTAIAVVGSKLISAGTECSLSVWDLDRKKSIGSFVDHNSQITDIYADAFKVMSCSRDFSIRVYSWVNMKDDDGTSFSTLDSRYTLLGGSLQRAGNGFEKVICDYATCIGMANDVMKAYSFQV